MYHAQAHHSGNNHPARAKAATAVASTVAPVCQLDASPKKRRRNTKEQTQAGTGVHVADGFLKTAFLPKLYPAQTGQAGKKTARRQADFYASLSRLAGYYHIEPMETRHFAYPYNVALAIWDLEVKLKQNVRNWQEVQWVEDGKRTHLISTERYNTDTTLYYIPVEPLYWMLRDRRRRKNAHLLISVFSYLYHVADIPYFRQEDSYLYWMYDMHKEWAEQDDDEDEAVAYIREFQHAELVGDCIEQKIFNRKNLKVFPQRVQAFKRRDTFDEQCWQLACDALAIYSAYPQESIFRNVPVSEDHEDEDNEYETISMDKYISFISDTRGWLYNCMCESINSEFNEYASMEEPTIVRRFDQKDVTTANLDFENRLFALITDICDLLYTYRTTEDEND